MESGLGGDPRVEEPKGHVCPECGAPRSADNSPSCACRQRAADALRDARTAEAAAAEDFDPLRIRPYVDYGDYGGSGDSGGQEGSWDHGGDGTGRGGAEGAGGTRGTEGSASPEGSGVTLAPGNPQAAPGAGPDTTTTTPPATKPTPTPVPTTDGTDAPRTTGAAHPADAAHNGETAAGARTEAPTRAVPAVEATMPLRTVALPAPLTPRADAPSATDLNLFDSGGTHAFESIGGAAGDGGGEGGAGGEGAAPEGRRRRRRPAALLAVSAAVVALAAACAYAGGLFSYKSPARDGAAHEVREGIPDAPTSAAPAAPPRSHVPAPSPSVSASASASPSATASPSASPSPSATSASPSPSGSTGSAPPGLAPTAPAQTASASPRVTRTPLPPATLRRGDRGPEVSELQERLARLYLYTGRIDGFYDQHVENSVRTYQWARGITTDGLGVYGPATRASLEAETSHR
nr:peptidoglycan-binding domain-containing protein [Streptomyces sp. Xyl84]